MVRALNIEQMDALAELYANVRAKNLEPVESEPFSADLVDVLCVRLDRLKLVRRRRADVRPAKIKLRFEQPLEDGNNGNNGNNTRATYAIEFGLTRVQHTIASADACTDKRIWKVKLLARRIGFWRRLRLSVVCKHYPGGLPHLIGGVSCSIVYITCHI